MPKEDIVPSVVLKKIVGIRKKERGKVYCLASPKHSNFVANGLVVANCDALRYMVYTHYGKTMGDEKEMTPEDLKLMRRRHGIV